MLSMIRSIAIAAAFGLGLAALVPGAQAAPSDGVVQQEIVGAPTQSDDWGRCSDKHEA